jgi:thiol-disulfide isomerase/thioredoxin
MIRISDRMIIALVLCCLSPGSWALGKGDVAPQFIGRSLDQKVFALSQLGAGPKVLNFFWVQCVPCREELPHLATLERQYPKVGFVAVHAEPDPDTGSGYELAAVQKFAASLSAHPRTVVLASELVKQQYGIPGLPFSLLLGADNRVEGVLKGYNETTRRQLQDWLQKQTH